MGKELFPKSKTELKSDNKRKVLTDRQLLAINRDKVITYFCQQWQDKYGIPYVVPPKSFAFVQLPITDVLSQNYTVDMLFKAINFYLSNEFVGYQEQRHPIRFFTKDIPKWVLQSKDVVKKQEVQKTEQDEIRELNFQYGIVKRGDQYISEDGEVFLDKQKAIEHSKGRK